VGSFATHPQKEEDTMTQDLEPTVLDPDDELLPVLYDPPASPAGLFGTDDPELVVIKAADVSKALAHVVRDRKLFVRINGKDYVLIGGWTFLGSMLGVFPVVVWSRRLDDGWEARVEARTRNGAIVGAAESECLRSERKWAKADDYAIRSMAQTRATAKALRLPLGFVFELEGFQGTPADELPDPAAAVKAESASKIPEEHQPTKEQLLRIGDLLLQLTDQRPETDWKAKARELAGAPRGHAHEDDRRPVDRQARELRHRGGGMTVPGEPGFVAWLLGRRHEIARKELLDGLEAHRLVATSTRPSLDDVLHDEVSELLVERVLVDLRPEPRSTG
jgi:hypothetical protein